MMMQSRPWLAGSALLLLLSPYAGLAAGGDAGGFQWRDFLGPFHNVVLHYPIGFITLAAILEIYALKHAGEELRRITRLVLWLALGSTVLAASLGFARAEGGGYQDATLRAHKIYGIAVIVLNVLAIGAYRRAVNPAPGGVMHQLYRLLLLGTFGTMIVTGHKGGDLTHGTNYLTKNAPPALKTLLEDAEGMFTEPETAAPVESAAMGEPTFFAQRVWPVLEAKCVKCHGPEKHKGDYRLDTRESALKPGESGQKPIVPGAPMESHLVRLVLLGEDDDDVMPPSGKEPLTDDERMALIRWIERGAGYDALQAPKAGGGN